MICPDTDGFDNGFATAAAASASFMMLYEDGSKKTYGIDGPG